MYYKIKDDIFFRKYDDYGYITDNSEFKYKKLSDNKSDIGEKYLSKSGALILSTLTKKPRSEEEILNELMTVFVDVDYNTLKNDMTEFFQNLVTLGYLSQGESFESCTNQDGSEINTKNDIKNDIKNEICKNLIKKNDYLRSIHIEISHTCNEKCIHCYIPQNRLNKMIEPELFYRILDEGLNLNIINVTISGGEPLAHNNILDFLIKCRKTDLSVNILSNLTLLDNQLIYEMQKHILLSIQTSLYSMNKNIHDSITRNNGSFDKTIKSLLQLQSIGIPIQISCPIMKQNKDSFVEVIKWAREKDIAVVVEPLIFAVYDHSKSNLLNRLSLDEFEKIQNILFQEGYANQIIEKAREKEKLTGDDRVCTICSNKICISPDGDVFPCVGWPTKILGNLNKQRLKEILENSEEIQYLRKIKLNQFPNCIYCKNRGYCTICMMNNYNENNNIFNINSFFCKAASITHRKIEEYFKNRNEV